MKNIIFAALVVAVCPSAYATLSLDQTDADFGVVPIGSNANDYLSWTGDNTAYGCFGCDIFANSSVQLMFEFFGSEAGFNNKLFYDNNLVFQTGGKTGGQTGVFGAPLLSFSTVFTVDAGSAYLPFSLLSPLGNAENGSNPLNEDGVPNFFITTDACLGTVDVACAAESFFEADAYWLFFDDAGGAIGDDDDHDDMVIRITASPYVYVPEPAAIGLLGLGAGLLGFMRVASSGRRAKKAQ